MANKVKIVIYKSSGSVMALENIIEDSIKEDDIDELVFESEIEEPFHPNAKKAKSHRKFVFYKKQMLGYSIVRNKIEDEEPIV